MSTVKKLVDQMLGEAEVNSTGAPPPPPPSSPRPEPTNMAGDKVHVRPDEEDLGDELDHDESDGEHAQQRRQHQRDALEDVAQHGAAVVMKRRLCSADPSTTTT